MSSASMIDKPADQARSGQLLDARVVRANAALTNLVLIVAIALLMFRPTAGLLVIFAQSVVFAVAANNAKRHPYRALARQLRGAFPEAESEHELPVRFAAKVGLSFTTLALLAALGGYPVAAVILTVCCAGAAGLNAYGNVCLACLAYPRLKLLIATVREKTLRSS